LSPPEKISLIKQVAEKLFIQAAQKSQTRTLLVPRLQAADNAADGQLEAQVR